jgi:hypothetical protein
MSDLEPNFDYSDNGYPVKEPVAYFALSIRQPNKIRMINVGPELVRCVQGSNLQNSISAENFSDKFSSSNFGQISTQKL